MNGNRTRRGFTLIELVVVLALVSILAAIVAPMVGSSITRARESALRENLYLLRKTIDDFYADKGHYPETLNQLVEQRYVRSIPDDPVSQSNAWALTYSKGEPRGIADIHSMSEQASHDGSAYASW
jgi:general secretion pathway protein G